MPSVAVPQNEDAAGEMAGGTASLPAADKLDQLEPGSHPVRHIHGSPRAWSTVMMCSV